MNSDLLSTIVPRTGGNDATPERFRSVYCWLAVYCRVQPYMHSILMDFQYNYNTGDCGQVVDERGDAVAYGPSRCMRRLRLCRERFRGPAGGSTGTGIT